MKLKPVLTEKSLAAARDGKFTFLVDPGLVKPKIAELVGKAFGVHVTSVRTMNYHPRVKTNLYRRKINVKGAKKAVVTLREKEKIDIFGGDKKK